MWRSRNRQALPMCVDVSQQLLHSVYLFNGNNQSLRRILGMCITRSVNRLIDKSHTKTTAQWSIELNFPIQLVSLRHDIVHGNLPSVYTLKQHSILLLRWLNTHYWQYQIDIILKNNGSDLREKLMKIKMDNDKDNTKINTNELFQYLKKSMGNNHIAVMEYFIPMFIDECLLDVSVVNGYQKDLNKVVTVLFEKLCVKWNSLIQRLIRQYPVLLAHFFLVLLKKRHKLMMEHTTFCMNEVKVKCGLMITWSYSIAMGKDLKSVWKSNFSKEQIIFIFENALKYLIMYKDQFSLDLVREIKKQAQKFDVAQDVKMLKIVNKVQNYIEPIKRGTKSDETLENLVNDRLEAQRKFERLMAGDYVQEKKEASEDEDEDEDGNIMFADSDSDEEDDDNDEDMNGFVEDQDENDKESEIACKWELTDECKFLPIGHSILPPL